MLLFSTCIWYLACSLKPPYLLRGLWNINRNHQEQKCMFCCSVIGGREIPLIVTMNCSSIQKCWKLYSPGHAKSQSLSRTASVPKRDTWPLPEHPSAPFHIQTQACHSSAPILYRLATVQWSGEILFAI